MNMDRPGEVEQHRTLQILDELSKDDALTQRDISSRLGIALGLANSYIKNLISKGFITVKSIPPRRYAYFLTPKGFTEKTRLTYDLLHDYTRIYREARNNLKKIFNEIEADGVRRVVFAGADEVAEIAYISLHETKLKLAGVVDDELAGKKFFGRDIRRIDDIAGMTYDCIVVTSYLKREKIYRHLEGAAAHAEEIKMIFPGNYSGG
jgi:DNA-binding MarR family transcriptional regulator